MILACLVQGQSNKQIARELEIAEATVKVHIKALLRKMQVSNRTQAAIFALQILNKSDRSAATANPIKGFGRGASATSQTTSQADTNEPSLTL
jgi:two-component system nitrate/nitrite response regulator NarL